MTATSSGGQQRPLLLAALVTFGTAAVLGAVLGWSVALGYLGGVVIGAGMFWVLVLCVNRLVAPPEGTRGPRWPYLLLHLGKFAGAVALAWLLVVVLKASVVGFAAGYLTALIGFLIIMNRSHPAPGGAG